MAAYSALCPRHRVSDVLLSLSRTCHGRLTDMSSRRCAVWVRPGAAKAAVGGVRDDGGDGLLVVSVRERAVDGAATQAVLEAVASVLGVKRGQVKLVSGFTSRRKVLEITDPPVDIDDRLSVLRGDSSA